MAKQLTTTTPELIGKLYEAFGVTPPQGRALNKVIVVLEPGKPAIFDEHTFLLEDAPVVETPAADPAGPAPDPVANN